MKYYKLTDGNAQSYDGTQWGENITHIATGKDNCLCTQDVIHVYDHPLKASMFNPMHANFPDPLLWECRVKGVVANDQLKVGVKQCTTIKQTELPFITTTQRIYFTILYALQVYHDQAFGEWANKWLSGEDRTPKSAEAAAAEAAWKAKAAAWAPSETTPEAAWAGWAAAWLATREAAPPGWLAEWARIYAVQANSNINLLKLIKYAIRREKS
ncbi:MAG: hypothetical protein ACUVTR_02100 [Dehalococcoidia bacterium]